MYLMSGTKLYYNKFRGSTFEDGSLPRIHMNIFGLGKLKESHKIVLQQWMGKFPPWIIKYNREESCLETAHFQAKSLMCLQLGVKGNLWPFFSL